MSKYILVLLLPLLAATAGFSQGTVVVKGNIKGYTKGSSRVIFYIVRENRPDSTPVKDNGTFSYRYPFKPGAFVRIFLIYKTGAKESYTHVSLMTDKPATIVLKDIDPGAGLDDVRIEGDPITVDYRAYERASSVSHEELSKLSDSARATRNTKIARAYVAAHPDSYSSAYVLSSDRSYIDHKELALIYEGLSQRIKESRDGKSVSEFIEGVTESKVGRRVKDFTLPTPDGKTLTFSSLKGKYVLLDFWASWCGPCRAAFPHMKEVYSKFKSDRFEIMSISIDDNRDSWLRQLKAQQLPWLQVLDDQHLYLHGFAITGVPTTYLIDPDGKIVMKELGFDYTGHGAMEKKLNELFEN